MGFFSNLLPIAGAAVGSMFGMPQVGAMVGSMAGSALSGGGGAGPVGAGGSQSSSTSGFSALPPAVQQAYTGIANQGSNLILNDPAKAAAMYTPLAQTADEKAAEGLSQPMTQQSVSDLANMYINPFSQYLMQNVKNNFQGQNSLYQNQLSGSGFAPGTTNRDFLNTGYLQGQEELAGGNILANQYNTALGQGLTQQQLTIQNLMGQGANARNIAAGTNQAPINALHALGSTLGLIPQSSTSSGTVTPNQLPNTNALLQSAQGLFSGFGGSGGLTTNGIGGPNVMQSAAQAFGPIDWS